MTISSWFGFEGDFETEAPVARREERLGGKIGRESQDGG